MAAKNQVFQKVSLDNKDYVAGLRAITKEQAETTVRIAKGLKEQGKAHQETSEQIKKRNVDVIKSMKEVGKAFTENLKKGTVIAGGVAIGAAFKSSVQEAAKSLLSLDQHMARIQSRFDLSKDKVKSLGKELRNLATATGVNGGKIGEAAEELISASGKKKQAIGISSVAQYSAMGGGAAPEIARAVIDYLKGSGQELNEENVKDLLTSATLVNRGGDLSLEDSLKALSVDPAVKGKLGLSNRENAAMIAAASGVGQNRGTSIQGMNALFGKAVGGFGEGAALSGIFGVGSFMKNGKFDMSKLSSASDNLNRQGLNKNDFIKLMESTGLNNGEAEGIYSILKDFKKFDESFKKVVSDQKTLEQSFKESTDNLPDSLNKLNENIAKATQEILSPGSGIAKRVLNGDFKGAVTNSWDAAKETGSALYENKGMVALGLGGLALSGAIATKLGGLFGGVGKGMAIEEATSGKVQAVYVVNLKELQGLVGGSGMGELAKTAGKGGLLAAIGAKAASIITAAKTTVAMGAMSVGGASATAMGGFAAAGGILGYGLGKYGANPLIDKFTQGTSSDGFEGNAIERLIFSIEKLVGTDSANAIQQANKMQFELIDQSGRFTAKPSLRDLSQQN